MFAVAEIIAVVIALAPGMRPALTPPACDSVASRSHAHVRASRRQLLALLPSLATVRTASASDLPFLGGSDPSRPRVEIVQAPDPSVCQGRARDQDFVVVRYSGRRTDSGDAFDARYAQQPLVFELGSFYIPGVDEALAGACVGSRFRFTWSRSPSLGTPEADALLPPGTPIEMDMELLSIKYSLFGEKMRNASSTYWFNPEPLSITSAIDKRGHASPRVPTIAKDNPFSIAPGEKSIISNPSSMLGPLFQGFF